jgi:MFS family permease
LGSDLYGRKRLYLYSAAILVVSLLLCGAAGMLPIPLDGMNQLIVTRGFLDLGNGAIIALTFTLVADLFPPSGLPPNRMCTIFQPNGDREGHDRSHGLP